MKSTIIVTLLLASCLCQEPIYDNYYDILAAAEVETWNGVYNPYYGPSFNPYYSAQYPYPYPGGFYGPAYNGYAGPFVDDVVVPAYDTFPEAFVAPQLERVDAPVDTRASLNILVDSVAAPVLPSLVDPVIPQIPEPVFVDQATPVFESRSIPVVAAPFIDTFDGPVVSTFVDPTLPPFVEPVVTPFFDTPVVSTFVDAPVVTPFVDAPVIDIFPGSYVEPRAAPLIVPGSASPLSTVVVQDFAPPVFDSVVGAFQVPVIETGIQVANETFEPTIEVGVGLGTPVFVEQVLTEASEIEMYPCGEPEVVHRAWTAAREQSRNLGLTGREVGELTLMTIASVRISPKQFTCIALEVGMSEGLSKDDASLFAREIARRSGTPDEISSQWTAEFYDKFSS